MATQSFHECEIKYKLTEGEVEELRHKVRSKGFKFIEKRTETDFVPDVPGFLCKENGFMIRFRNLESENDNDILVTMKIKGTAKHFQEYFEYEYKLSKYKPDIFKEINSRLEKVTQLKVPEEVNYIKDFKQLINFVKQSGFSEHRILLAKQREEFKRSPYTITLDYLPEGIGHYLEMEANSPENLEELISEFELQRDLLEIDNYGNILKEHKKGQPEVLRRTALFTSDYSEYGINVGQILGNSTDSVKKL